jgi:acyl carrier protein
MDPRGLIRDFLHRSFRNFSFQDDEDIFATGFVNSMFAIQLVMFVESTFGISVESEDLEVSNFNTIDAIHRFVEKKRSGVRCEEILRGQDDPDGARSNC